MQKQPEPALSGAVNEVVAAVEKGRSLDDALASHPRVFPSLAIHLIGVGMQSGRLVLALERLSQLLEAQVRLARSLTSALLYPASLLLTTVVMALFIVGVVFPSEMQTLESMGAEFPPFSRHLARLVSTVFSPQLALVVILAAGLFSTFAPRGSARLRERFEADLHAAFLNLPAIGAVIHKAESIRILFTMVTLLEAGATFRETRSAGLASRNLELRRRFNLFHDGVREGLTIAESMATFKVFPRLVVEMTRIGEEHGSLPTLLDKAASMFEEDVEASLTTLRLLLEPLAIAIMGLVVGCLVLATMLPMLQMISTL